MLIHKTYVHSVNMETFAGLNVYSFHGFKEYHKSFPVNIILVIVYKYYLDTVICKYICRRPQNNSDPCYSTLDISTSFKTTYYTRSEILQGTEMAYNLHSLHYTYSIRVIYIINPLGNLIVPQMA